VTRAADQPAFYARSTGTGGVRDWVTLLHPPYTAWHLSYVAVGAALAPGFTTTHLLGALLAFFLAVGVGAHALDELAGRPLRTGIPSRVLVAAATASIAAPVVAGLVFGGLRMLPLVVVGLFLVLAYNLELGAGVVHTGTVFALGWGAFPVVVGYVAQDLTLGVAVVPAAAAAFLLSLGQRALSTPARLLRRRTRSADAQLVHLDGSEERLGREQLLAPLEAALKATAWGLVLLAASLVASRL
jgi:hypothetical protein